MKTFQKTIVLAFLFFFGMQQQNFAQEFSLGLKTGVQSANVKVPGFIQDASFLPDFKSVATYNVGVVGELSFGQNFAIQTDLNYTQKGFQLNEDFDLSLFNIPLPVGATAISKFQYLEMPLLAKAKFGTGNTQLYLLAGPTFGYALSGNLKTRARFIFEVDVSDTNINLDAVNYERFEVGGMAGVGFNVNTGFGQFFMDARYSHGFTQPYDIPLVHERVQHYNLGLNAGILIPLGG